MPVLIIGGDSEKGDELEDKGMPMSSMRKHSGGIGGKFSLGSDDSSLDAGNGDTEARKTEAGKLLLRAIAKNDPKLAGEAVATICECVDSDDDNNEDTADGGTDEESEA